MKHILNCHPIHKTDFVKGQGCLLYDKRGKPYLDCESGVWCTALGHSHPRITDIISKQSARLTNIGFRFGTEEIEQAATALLDILGFANGKCVFLTSGSEAMDLSMKLAQVATHRNKFVGLEPSYLAAFGQGADVGGNRWTSIERHSDTLKRTINWLQVGALVLEPGSAGGSVQFPSATLIQELAQHTQNSGGLVVVDEVTTGMGRTGQWFGYNHFDIRPDIVAVGKGLGNGYPVSAVAVREEVAETIEATGLHYIQSHQNDPLGCAVANEVIDTIHEEDLIQQSRDKGDYFYKQLLQAKETCPAIVNIRGKGLMLAVEFSEAVKAPDLFERLLERGMLVGCNPSFNIIRFMPPLTIEHRHIDECVHHLKDLLNTMQSPQCGQSVT